MRIINKQLVTNPKYHCVFIHGFLGHHSNFDRLIPHLSAGNYYGVALDGHYYEDLVIQKPEINPQQIAQKLAEWMKTNDLNNVVLIAHSLGAMISVLLTNLVPERIKQMVLISPYLPVQQPKSWYQFHYWFWWYKQVQLFFQVKSLHDFTSFGNQFTNALVSLKLMSKQEQGHLHDIWGVYQQYGAVIWPQVQALKMRVLFTNCMKVIMQLWKATQTKKIKQAIIQGISQCQMSSIPILYCYGQYHDFFTPFHQNLTLLTKYHKNVTLCCLAQGSHVAFLSDWNHLVNAVISFMQINSTSAFDLN